MNGSEVGKLLWACLSLLFVGVFGMCLLYQAEHMIEWGYSAAGHSLLVMAVVGLFLYLAWFIPFIYSAWGK